MVQRLHHLPFSCIVMMEVFFFFFCSAELGICFPSLLSLMCKFGDIKGAKYTVMDIIWNADPGRSLHGRAILVKSGVVFFFPRFVQSAVSPALIAAPNSRTVFLAVQVDR